MVEFYSPGCAHCAAFASEYDQLAREVYEEKKLGFEVVAIDLKKNMETQGEVRIG